MQCDHDAALSILVEDLLERAAAADRAAALADDLFDIPARDGYRGRALAYRHAAHQLAQLVGAEPGKVAHG